jgi:hypothetical protein
MSGITLGIEIDWQSCHLRVPLERIRLAVSRSAKPA